VCVLLNCSIETIACKPNHFYFPRKLAFKFFNCKRVLDFDPISYSTYQRQLEFSLGALFGVPIHLHTLQGRQVQQFKTRPECWIRGLNEASTQSTEATSANLFWKECLGLKRSPKDMLFRSWNAIVTSQPGIGWQAVTSSRSPS
jgi:hypothetical protein